MAGTSAPNIYCWDIKLDRLYVHMASTKKGALRIGMGLDAGVNAKTFFKKSYPDAEVLENREINALLQKTIEAAFWGRPLQEALRMDVACTPFQWAAMKAIADIPFGETRTYKEVAAMAGKSKGARAIGQAMGRNPLPLIFPCHRVVAAAGLGGFGSGLDVKRYLLKHEQRSSHQRRKNPCNISPKR